MLDDDENRPDGLPQVQISKTQSALDRSRICPKCKKEGRVISNSSGLNVFCNPCKWGWPISSTPMAPTLPMTSERGLSKQTLVEPNWDLAYEDDIGENRGPPGKR